VSLETKRDLLARFRGPYEEAGKPEKGRILDNLCEATGWNRKYAMSALRQLPLKKRKVVRKRKRRYGLVEEAALHQAWKLSGYLASKRLAPFMEEFLTILERHGELTLAESTKKKLSVISAATIDRLLKRHRNSHPRPLCSTKPGGLLKKQIALRMGNEWSEDVPGYCEIDTVAHSGGAGDGDFFYTLSLTDVCTGWFEGAALRNKSRKETVDRLKSIQKRLPFKILGLDSDNGSEFINYHLKKLLRRARDPIHPLSPLSQERPVPRRTEELQRGETPPGLRPLRHRGAFQAAVQGPCFNPVPRQLL